MLPQMVITLESDFLEQYSSLAAQSKALAEDYQNKTKAIEDETLKAVGSALWQALDCEKAFLEKEQASGQEALNIIIESDHPQVLNLAWETLYHADFGFLGKSERFTLSRRIPMQPTPTLPAVKSEPLRILYFAAMPMDLGEHGRLQTEEEKAQILQAVAPLEDQGLVELIAPEDGRFASFKSLLQQHQPHLVYLSGHGTLHHNTIENTYHGQFLFEDERAESLEITEDELVECFNNTQVQALILSACESGKFDARDLNNGLSIRLSQKGIPHVIGMRESILDQAGLEFATTLLQRMAQKQSIAVALQAARLAIKSHVTGYVSREVQNNPLITPISKQQWCLPSLISHDVSQPLVDWSFMPKPKEYGLNFNNSLENISLPEQFLGRKRELYQLTQPLLSGTQSSLLLTAAGGMGKTALAGKLCDNLKDAGFEIFAYSAREGNQWNDFLQDLELALQGELAQKYDTQKSRLSDERKAQTLLQYVLMQHQGKVVFFLDNLESIQDPQSRALNEAAVNQWLAIAQRFINNGLRLILTSRWKLPDWQGTHHALEKPAFSDFIAFARQKGLLTQLQSHDYSREVYEVLGGNFRAFEFFVKASHKLGAKEKDELLHALNQAKDESQTDMALAKVLSQRSEQERALLTRLLAYPVAVPMMGVSVMALRVHPPLSDSVEHAEYLENLANVSLIERVDNQEFSETDYQVAPLVRDYLLQHEEEVSEEARRKAALYLHDELLEDRPRLDLALVVHKVLLSVGEVEKAQDLLLVKIRPKFDLAGLYHTLLNDYLLPSLKLPLSKENLAATQVNIGYICQNIGDYDLALEYMEQALPNLNKKGKGATLNNISQIFNVRGDYETALQYLKKSLAIRQDIGDKSGEGTTLNNMATTAHARGDYETALQYLKQSLAIRQDIGDKSGEGTTLNNISGIYRARGDYETALDYLKQSLAIQQDIGDKSGEGTTLNNISQIYDARGDYETALQYLKQSLAIQQEIGDRSGLCATLFNMGHIHWQNDEQAEAVSAWVTVYKIAKDIGEAQVLEALEGLAQQLGLEGSLAGWEELVQQMEEE